MLKVPQLDDLTYEQMINRAISRIPTMTDEWTDFNSHDPGITVLQTYAWLTDMLNYYMNATGDVHIQKYLKLLGIEPKQAHAAESYVILEGINEAIDLKEGTRFFAGQIPFELAEDSTYQYNDFCSFIQETDSVGMDLTAFAGNDGDFAEVFSENYQNQACAYFGFQKPLKDDDSIYICVKEEKKRNSFGQEFGLCELLWECFTEEGWKSFEVSDQTCGFLKSGFLKIHLYDKMTLWNHPDSLEQAYYIRCTLKANYYDKIPEIGKIYVNPLKVIQKATICKMGEIRPELQIGITNGCAEQELLFDYPDVYRFSLAICEDEDDLQNAEIWTMTENLEEADYKAKMFCYDRERRKVCFGDGIYGAVPKQHLKVFVTGLEVSFLDLGNVLAGEICTTTCKAAAGAKIYNPIAASEGSAQEDTQDMLKRLEDTLFVQNRMVSEEDYQKIILNTPGLMLDLVHVIPGNVYGNIYRQNRMSNEIMVVVKPYSQMIAPKLSEVYKRMITEHIEKYRLLNTKVSIVSPAYVGIEIEGKIVLRTDSAAARKNVLQKIRELINYNYQKEPFGAVISYGKIFTMLESMDEVQMIHELYLEKNSFAAVKNDRGDIICQEDALCYAERMEIEFC